MASSVTKKTSNNKNVVEKSVLPKKQIKTPKEEINKEKVVKETPEKVVKEKVVKETPEKVVKEKVVKEKPEKVVKEKPEKVVKEKVVKEKPEKESKKRVIDFTEKVSTKTGLNISVSRIKKIITDIAINGREYDALKELKDAYEKPETKKIVKDNETETTKIIPAVPCKNLSDLSEKTLELLEQAKQKNLLSKKMKFFKKKISQMTGKVKTDYSKKHKVARDAHDLKMKFLLDDEKVPFDEESFILSFDKNFYDTFNVESDGELDELKQAVNLISKLKVRFSASPKILISSFIELLIKQLVSNGIYNCMKSDKKTTHLKHALDNTLDGFDERFPLFPCILNFKTYINAVKNDELLESNKLNTQGIYHFKYYIKEICKNVRIKMANDELNNEDQVQKYTNINISKDFKEFCSDLVIEFIMKLGQILKTEINTRHVKTVNSTIVKSMIYNIHSFCGVDPTSTFKFIDDKINIYNKYLYVKNKEKEERKKKKEEKK